MTKPKKPLRIKQPDSSPTWSVHKSFSETQESYSILIDSILREMVPYEHMPKNRAMLFRANIQINKLLRSHIEKHGICKDLSGKPINAVCIEYSPFSNRDLFVNFSSK